MDHSSVLVEQNRLLGELVRTADPATPVPTCPDWTVRQLLTHVGRGDRWAAKIVGDRADAPVDTRSVPDGKPPADMDAAVGWFADGATLLLDAVAATGADTPVWTFTGPKPAGWWVRRRVYESVVHRADAAIALGVPYAVDPEVAADGLSEWLALVAARPSQDPPLLAAGEILHLHATDDGLGADGEWMVHGTEAGISWEHGHGKGGAAVRGSAADLLLGALRRIPADAPGLEVRGDEEVWTGWVARTPF